MIATNDGGPAFPCTLTQDEWVTEYRGSGKNVKETTHCEHRRVSVPGISMRDWFAGQALAGIKWQGYEELTASAQVCYALADAMLAARGGAA
jgi:hypothetical protein